MSDDIPKCGFPKSSTFSHPFLVQFPKSSKNCTIYIYIIHYIIYICIPWATGSPGLTNESVRQAAAFAFMASDGARNAKKAWSEQRRSLT